MAFSALSMAHSQGVQNLSALQHYDKALPYLQNSLRSSIDLSSDGALLTHFLLLLYEVCFSSLSNSAFLTFSQIAAAEPRGTNLWSQHLSQLLRIVMLRHELYGRENYSFVIWWTVSIDTHSILTGSGRGDFVKTMLASGILSDPSIAGQASTFDFDNTSTASTAHPGPSVLVFHRSILILAARLGLLAQEIRYSVAQSYGRQTQASRAEVIQRQHRVEQLRNSLRETWELQAPTFDAMGYCNENVPVQSRGIFEHVSHFVYWRSLFHTFPNKGDRTCNPPCLTCVCLARSAYRGIKLFGADVHTGQTYALYHACIIYSHTSMWPNQRLDNGPQPIQETTHSINRIIQLGHEITSNGFIERKFMVFPLFMAGIASQNPPDHQQVIRLLITFENQSIGKAMVATRQILETVYEKQREVIMLGADPLMVDWIDTVAERGLQMIDARL